MPVCRLCAAVLLLAPSTCHDASDVGGAVDDGYDAVRLPRIRVVVEVDVLGSSSPRVRAEVSRFPTDQRP
jgi:hypothetical protein